MSRTQLVTKYIKPADLPRFNSLVRDARIFINSYYKQTQMPLRYKIFVNTFKGRLFADITPAMFLMHLQAAKKLDIVFSPRGTRWIFPISVTKTHEYLQRQEIVADLEEHFDSIANLKRSRKQKLNYRAEKITEIDLRVKLGLDETATKEDIELMQKHQEQQSAEEEALEAKRLEEQNNDWSEED